MTLFNCRTPVPMDISEEWVSGRQPLWSHSQISFSTFVRLTYFKSTRMTTVWLLGIHHCLTHMWSYPFREHVEDLVPSCWFMFAMFAHMFCTNQLILKRVTLYVCAARSRYVPQLEPYLAIIHLLCILPLAMPCNYSQASVNKCAGVKSYL